MVTEQWRYIQYADGSEELYDIQQDEYEWNNLAGKEGYKPVLDDMRKRLPGKVEPPAPGNTVRLVELKDGVPYWQGKAIPKGADIPMSFK